MKTVSRFLTRHDPAAVHVTLDGVRIAAQPGDSVAAALLAHSGDPARHSATGAARTAFCMMGVCYDCLVEVDGHPNVQSCMIAVREGMVLRRQRGLRPLVGGGHDA